MLVAVVSSKGSPGGSTTALAMALTWPEDRPVILAELDPRGGDVVWSYGRGQNIGTGGLLRLQVVASRRSTSSEILWREVVELPGAGQRWLLPGLNEPREAGSVNWATVARVLRSVEGADVIADCGSVFVDRDRAPRAVWSAADLVALAVRPTLAGTHVARSAAALLREDLIATGFGPDRLRSFVVSCRHGYGQQQLAPEMADYAPMVDETLPYDPDSADVLAGLRDQGRRFLTRAPLMQQARKLGLALGGSAEEFVERHRPVAPPATPDTQVVGQNPFLMSGPLVTPRPPGLSSQVATGMPLPAPKLGSRDGLRREPAPMNLRATKVTDDLNKGEPQ